MLHRLRAQLSPFEAEHLLWEGRGFEALASSQEFGETVFGRPNRSLWSRPRISLRRRLDLPLC